MKACSKCGVEKPLSLFFRDSSKPSGYRPDCKACCKSAVDKERRREYEKEYWSNPERAEKRKEQIRNCMARNHEKYAERRREYLKTDAGVAMYRKQTQKRYALRKAAFVEDVNPLELFQEQNGVCYLCLKKFEFTEMELDHVMPISKGGKHEKSNCKMACAHCNRSKGPKTLEELSYQMV